MHFMEDAMCDHMETEIQGTLYQRKWEGDFYVQKEVQVHHCTACDNIFSLDEFNDF